jgi:predicted dehydrogenase
MITDRKPRIGLIGTGMIAERHIDNLNKTGRAEVTWLAEIREDVLKKVQDRFNIPNGSTDYKELLAAEEVDAVIICTPPKTHVNIFMDVLKAGKHVLVEKPAAITLEEVDLMIQEARKYPDLMVMEASGRHSRLQPKFNKIKEIMDSGKLGKVYYIHHNCVFRQGRGGIEYHPTAKWFLNKAIAGGGPLFDWGVYDLSFHLGLFNDEPELKSVKTLFTINGLDKVDPGTDIFDVEEHGATLMEFSNGMQYFWERATNANMDVPNETRIYGTEGGLKFGFCSWDDPTITFFDVDEGGKGKAREKNITVDLEGHIHDEYQMAEHFIDVLTGKTKPVMPLELARKHLDIIFKVYEAANS